MVTLSITSEDTIIPNYLTAEESERWSSVWLMEGAFPAAVMQWAPDSLCMLWKPCRPHFPINNSQTWRWKLAWFPKEITPPTVSELALWKFCFRQNIFERSISINSLFRDLLFQRKRWLTSRDARKHELSKHTCKRQASFAK